jgi:hypothetical protein
MCATCPTHLILIDLTAQNIWRGVDTRWFKYDRDGFVCTQARQSVPVIFEPPCIMNSNSGPPAWGMGKGLIIPHHLP